MSADWARFRENGFLIETELLKSIDVANTLGEGVVWRESDQTVWWTDIQAARLFCMNWPGGDVETFDLPERLGSFGLVQGDDAKLICAFENGFALYEPAAGELKWLSHPEDLKAANVRMNDGRVAPDGVFWAGSMHEGEGPLAGRTGFYRLGAAGEAQLAIPGIGIPNGTAWSPSGDRFYYADTARAVVYRCAASAGEPDLGSATEFCRPETGAPDGAAVDMSGRYWSATWGAGCLNVYFADGALEARIDVLAPQPTCIAFGGPDMDLAFVTSAREGLDQETLDAFPKSGSLFVFRTNVRGLPANRYILQP